MIYGCSRSRNLLSHIRRHQLSRSIILSIMRNIFPFTAIVGQERMKRALVLNAIYPQIGGVLIRGERGTAKSTAARALAALLPEIEVVQDCRFGCDPDQPATWCTECRERAAKNGQDAAAAPSAAPSLSICP